MVTALQVVKMFFTPYGVRSLRKLMVWILNSTLAFKLNSSIWPCSLCIFVKLQLHSRTIQFQLNAVNKTIHWTNFPTLLRFIRLNAGANTWFIFPLTESHFKLDHAYFQQNFWIFVYTTVIIDQDQGAPPKKPLSEWVVL